MKLPLNVPHSGFVGLGTSLHAKRVTAPPSADTSNDTVPPVAAVPVYVAPGTGLASAAGAATVSAPTSTKTQTHGTSSWLPALSSNLRFG